MSEGLKEFFSDAQAKWILWRLAIVMVCLYSIDAIATAFISVMMDSEWSELTNTQKWIRVFLIVKAWASAMLALFTNASRRIQDNEFPLAPLSHSKSLQDQNGQQAK